MTLLTPRFGLLTNMILNNITKFILTIIVDGREERIIEIIKDNSRQGKVNLYKARRTLFNVKCVITLNEMSIVSLYLDILVPPAIPEL